MAMPIIPWLGGKRRLADRIFKFFDNTHTCYVEPFAGGAALFFMKPPSDVEVVNDINGELINLYRVVQNHLEEFVRQFKWALSSRRVFEWLKATRPETLAYRAFARSAIIETMLLPRDVTGWMGASRVSPFQALGEHRSIKRYAPSVAFAPASMPVALPELPQPPATEIDQSLPSRP